MKEDRLQVRSWSILLSVLCGVCLIFHVITLSSPRWLVTTEGHAGIWVFCPSVLILNDTVVPVTGNSNMPCNSLRASISIVVIIFYVISLLLTIATLALVVKTITTPTQNEEHRLRYGFILQCLSCLLLVIVLIMKAVSPLEYENGPADLGWPFFLTIITTFFHSSNCILIILQIRRLRLGPQYTVADTGANDEATGVLRTPSTRQRLNIEIFTREEMEATKTP